MSNKNLKIDGDNAGRRIDNYLFNVYKALPKSKIYSMLRKGEVRVNSGRIKPTHKLKINELILSLIFLLFLNLHSWLEACKILDYLHDLIF